jgi:hypothetical protein
MRLKCFAAVFLAASCVGLSASHAGWIDGGMPLSSRPIFTGNERVITDGASGAIIVFQACLHGNGRIYAERVDASGALLWGTDAVGVCAADGDQREPQAAADGCGGAIIAWSDSRVGGEAVYAQRLNAAGAPLWAASGVLVSAVADQRNIRVISDGAGGAIVVWQDSRSGSYCLYAQRLDAAGNVLWASNGVSVCTAAGQNDPSLASDGSGGAIIAWSDTRTGNSDIYTQRLSSSGLPLWTANGIGICTIVGYDYHALAVPDGSGGAIIAWHDSSGTNNQDIRAQRVNGAGAIQWQLNGVPIPTATVKKHLRAAADGLGGIVIAWETPGGSGWPDIYAQRLDGSGACIWGAGNLAIRTSDSIQESIALISDGVGGATFAWVDRGFQKIRAQRVDASGAVQWVVNGVAVSGTGAKLVPYVVPSVAGGTIIIWSRDGPADPVWGQRLSASGTAQWTYGVCFLRSPDNRLYTNSISDGAGGAFIAWVDEYGTNKIYAQHVDDYGHALWQAGGIQVSSVGAIDQSGQTMAPDGAGGMFIAWSTYVTEYGYCIFAQRFDASGVKQWTANGVRVFSSVGQIYARLVSDGAGGVFVISNRNVQRLNGAGVAQWAGSRKIASPGSPEGLAAVLDGAGGLILAWETLIDWSRRFDVFAQRLNAQGDTLWGLNGIAICSELQDQRRPILVRDGAGGAIIAWLDSRVAGEGVGIYAQRLNGEGIAQWAASGILVAGEHRSLYSAGMAMAPDGAGGGIIAYARGSTNTSWDLYAQRFDASGNVLWETNDVAICTASGMQLQQSIIPDYAGGAIVAWVDGRWNGDIYAQRIDASGSALWTPDGVGITALDDYNQSFLSACGDGAGGAILAWADRRCGPWAIYAQRVTVSGGLVATLLQHYSAAIEGGGVRVDWVLSDIDSDTRFFVMRAEQPDRAYEELTNISIEREGLAFRVADKTCLPGTAYKYRIDYAAPGKERRSLFETESVALPALPAILYQNHPNPFNPRTTIRFYLPQAEDITLIIFDIRGAMVARLAEGKMVRGYHEAIWDGRNASGAACASGVYFSRLRTATGALSKKIILLR